MVPGGTLFSSSSMIFRTAMFGVPNLALRIKLCRGMGLFNLSTTVSSLSPTSGEFKI